MRLDLALFERGLCPSRQQAHERIVSGGVTVNGAVVRKPSHLVGQDARIELSAPSRFVGRGGYKLLHALEVFSIPVDSLVAADIGASTGGFTDCLLQHGAARVYAVDVGTGQLAPSLQGDPRVVSLEQTNIRDMPPERLPEPVDLAVVDVSFISLRLVLPATVRLLRPGGALICLIKPQFEAGRAAVGKGGVVRDPKAHREVLAGFFAWCGGQGLSICGATPSPFPGGDGNLEFLVFLRPGGASVPVDPVSLVAEAHRHSPGKHRKAEEV